MAINIEKVPQKSSQIFPWGTSRPYNAYGDFIKKKFGSRVQKVIVDAGFSCPNRDGSKGYGGCTYCNNDSFKPRYCNPELSIAEQVTSGIEFLSRRYKADKFMVYFQPYSNTHAPLEELKKKYEQALQHPQVIGLSIGTRPDCIDEAKIAYLQELAQKYFITIEYGLESPYDETLRWINRQHDFQSWVQAVELTAGRGIHICCHIILGFPSETREMMLGTAKIISRHPIDDLKIHHLHIVPKTVLAKRYQDEPFPLLGYEEYIQFVAEFLSYLRPDIKIQRLAGETPPGMLIAPDWGVKGGEIQRRIEAELNCQQLWQGKKYFPEVD
jgi:radical SAM protein (TIGR01212 family)